MIHLLVRASVIITEDSSRTRLRIPKSSIYCDTRLRIPNIQTIDEYTEETILLLFLSAEENNSDPLRSTEENHF